MVFVNLLRWVLLVTLGLLTGLEFCASYCVHPALLGLEPKAFLPIRQALNHTFTPIVANLIFATGLLLFINLFTVKSKKSIEFMLYLGAFVFFTVGILITINGTVPINIMYDKMDPSFPPANLFELRDRWNTLNDYRTWSSMLGFAMYCVAVLFKPTSK